MGMRHRWCRAGLLTALLLAAGPASATPAVQDPYRALNDSWERFGSIYTRIVEDYYDSLGQATVMRAAIDGMLARLDAYSQFYDQDGVRQLRQDTTGKFAGLGITVGLRNRYPLVLSTIPNTPAAKAGLVPGDQITRIDGTDAADWPLDRIVRGLRGDVGSRVRLTVVHPGKPDLTRDVAVIREVIRLRTVAQSAQLQPGIGYISLRQTRFSEDTAAEVKQALAELQKSPLQGVIVDLRGNPGGLLTQATGVASLLLPPGAPIVTTRERDGRHADTQYAQGDPLPAALRLAILVDGGSASAAEIVAGAVQDNDRGVVVGTPTYGKGSVQTVFDLADETAALKLTTAHYYTPSGRCIHREPPASAAPPRAWFTVAGTQIPAVPALTLLGAARSPAAAAAALRARFDLSPTDAAALLATPLGELLGWPDSLAAGPGKAGTDSVYHTQGGRPVTGGGGITPDITVAEPRLPDYIQDLEQRRAFFDFVIDLVAADSLGAAALDTTDGAALVGPFLASPPAREAAAAALARASRHLRAAGTVLAAMGWAIPDSLQLASPPVPTDPALLRQVQQRLKRELHQRLTTGTPDLVPPDPALDPTLSAAVELLLDPPRLAQVLARPTH